jgi:hypothetical protein
VRQTFGKSESISFRITKILPIVRYYQPAKILSGFKDTIYSLKVLEDE